MTIRVSKNIVNYSEHLVITQMDGEWLYRGFVKTPVGYVYATCVDGGPKNGHGGLRGGSCRLEMFYQGERYVIEMGFGLTPASLVRWVRRVARRVAVQPEFYNEYRGGKG